MCHNGPQNHNNSCYLLSIINLFLSKTQDVTFETQCHHQFNMNLCKEKSDTDLQNSIKKIHQSGASTRGVTNTETLESKDLRPKA